MGNRVFLLQKRDGPLKRLFWNDGSSFQSTRRVGKEQRRLESLQRDLFLNNISCSIFVKVSIVLWIGRSDQIFSLYPTLCEATFFVVEKKNTISWRTNEPSGSSVRVWIGKRKTLLSKSKLKLRFVKVHFIPEALKRVNVGENYIYISLLLLLLSLVIYLCYSLF